MSNGVYNWFLIAVLIASGCASGGGRSQPVSGPIASTASPPTLQVLYESGDDQQLVGRVATTSPDSVAPSDLWFAVHSYLRLGRQDEARRALARLREAPDPAWQAVAGLLLATLNGDAAAIDAARGAAAAFPTHPYVQYELGVSYAFQNDFGSAARAFDAAINADPAFSYAYYQAALAYERLNRNDLVVIRLEMFVRLAPSAPERRQADAILRTVRGL